MNPEIKKLQRKLLADKKRQIKAQLQVKATEQRLAEAHRALSSPVTSLLSAKDLGELVADAARSHGHECHINGGAYTSPSWKQFRILLAELVKKAQ